MARAHSTTTRPLADDGGQCDGAGAAPGDVAHALLARRRLGREGRVEPAEDELEAAGARVVAQELEGFPGPGLLVEGAEQGGVLVEALDGRVHGPEAGVAPAARLRCLRLGVVLLTRGFGQQFDEKPIGIIGLLSGLNMMSVNAEAKEEDRPNYIDDTQTKF